MPRASRQALIWSHDGGRYALHVEGRAMRHFGVGDEAAWQDWLSAADGFAFHGAAGGLNVHREARPRGGRYWYAYHTAGGRTRKRYLGATARVTLARLEEVAADLAGAARPALPAIIPAASVGAEVDLLPAAKLAPPQIPAVLVGREPLLAALDAAIALPLTLVAAPAGWGKTTALAAWEGRNRRRVAWLSLDATDDTPPRFWAAVIAALRRRVPGIGATALALLRAPQPPPPAVVVTALLNELAGLGAGGPPLALVLDDYQAITDETIHEAVGFCLERLPAQLRLVIASRADPPLPLARLRARGWLAELRAADLRFSEDDTAAFLRGALDAPLADADVAALAARTEGWAAGLQLAALALRGQPDRAAWMAGFTGGHRFLLDYVEEEILARQPDTVRRFLLRVAVLPRLGADLCASVTGEAASGAILAGLERQNLFVAPLDAERRWYRLHDLFREALLARAAAEPGLLPAAHRRAAEWQAAHGDAREAIAHALAGEDYPLAADLIEGEAPRLWLGGEASTVHAWLEALPDAVLWRRARLALDAALRLLDALHETADAPAAGARARAERTLARLEGGLRARAGPALPAAQAAVIRRRARLLRALIAGRALLARGDAAGLEVLAGEVAGLAAREEVRWRTIAAALAFWLRYSIRRDGGALIPDLLALQRRALRAGDRLSAIRAGVWLAYLYAAAGRLRLAERECLTGLGHIGRLGADTAMAGYLQLRLSAIYRAWGRPGEAAVAARTALGIARAWQQADQLFWAHLALADLALAGGDPAGADAALKRAEEIATRELEGAYAPDAGAARARYWLATGAPDRAAAGAARVAVDPRAWPPTRAEAFLIAARAALARRRYGEAVEALERHAAQLDRPGDIPATVEYLALRLAALHGAGRGALAREVATRLFALTEPEGWVRPYLEAGEPMARALAELLAAPDGETPDVPALPRSFIARLLAAFETGRRAGGRPAPPPATATRAAPLPGGVPAPPAHFAPLTPREREVLGHLAAGTSNRAIAATLSISPFTVKRHVGSLLGKLGAASRTAAVARAREVGLL